MYNPCIVPYLHTLIAHAFLTVHHRRQSDVRLLSIHQNENLKIWFNFLVKASWRANALPVVTESHGASWQRNSKGGRKSRVVVALLQPCHFLKSLFAYISHRMTGKSTWIRGWSKWTIPCKHEIWKKKKAFNTKYWAIKLNYVI